MFYVSTSWNFRQHSDANGILEEIKELDVNGIELNFNLSTEIAKGFASLKKENKVDIVSLHNYCPIPNGVDPKKASPDNPSLGSMDERERKFAIECTKNTINFASEIGTKIVILHIGRVDINDKTVKLSQIDSKSPLYAEMKDKMKKEREAHAQPYFEKAIKSLEELETYARKHDICLGIENRYYFREMPSVEEIDWILNHFGESNIYYWHDVGHAQMLENLGLACHEDHLRRFSRKLIGIHLHDIIGIEDHKVPGDGKFDFRKLLPYVTKDVSKIIEAHQPATVADMKRGIKFLKEIFKED